MDYEARKAQAISCVVACVSRMISENIWKFLNQDVMQQ